ncbi:AmmeMemoRadiSam system radical SAM enzyme [Thalassobaculum sp. OXR-137]|uniref:AmmeMemoRadiSam system radical SAM enzyme n=1 Tax=Thalassobaculum sp. OXR-137 TaxID=3100173 RepID=UPI002AC8DE12|nr:AmmeMemoRadiSam system radical SAM enzyme [Thalassobaculum sp. OXR-137]WPZ36462.1 AmmeMemoRadiSam system radical SAM enzyme [Thalassobaculum sp. OXR-137]
MTHTTPTLSETRPPALSGKGPIVPTTHWRMLGDGRVQCEMCPRYCKLKEGARGLCFVRARQGDAVVLTTYGRSSGFCIDPIEKKPLNHFLPGTPVLSFGTAGCNLACNFCQNHDISKSREMDAMQAEAQPEALAATAARLGCRSVAFTYNDPVIFHEYAEDVAQACHERGIKNVAVTAGYITERARADFFRHVDAANVDLKAFTERFYRDVTKSELAVVLETLEYLVHETDVWVEITNLLIPGENDGEAELEAMTQWVVDRLGPDVPMHFSAFHPDYRMLDKQRTPFATLAMARRIARKNGVRHAYTGNVHDVSRQSSYCHTCGDRVIERDWYELGAWKLDAAGACTGCGTRLPGVFDGPPGVWGRKRLPVSIG